MMQHDQPQLADHYATGGLGVFHLERLWSRSLRDRRGVSESVSHEWALDNVVYHGLNLPIEETIQYLYQNTPTLAEFERWILQRNGGALHQNSVERINAAIAGILTGSRTKTKDETVDKVLTDFEMEHWDRDGYLVVSGLFGAAAIAEAEQAVWRYIDAAPDDPESWYHRNRDHGIMMQFFHHPALEAIRNAPELKAVFAQIWETNELWISTDRVSFNPPERPGYEFPGPRLHWDVSLDLPIPFGVQGLVYLTDTTADQGAFTCVPGFHNRIEAWLQNLPRNVEPRDQNFYEMGAMPIAGQAGDLIIWHQALPHGSSPNRTTRPRIVEYVTMFPADADYAENWK